MKVRRLLRAGALALLPVACSGSSKSPQRGTDAGVAPAMEPVAAAGRCELAQRTTSASLCSGVLSSIVVRGDGADAALSAPNGGSGETYLHVFDGTCEDDHWTLSACAAADEPPCVWISNRGKDGGLCGEYEDRDGVVWSLTALTGEPVEDVSTQAVRRGEHVVGGELVADFQNSAGTMLSLTLELDACGPDLTRCCLC